jgi:superfamily I DNA/RNA helicase
VFLLGWNNGNIPSSLYSKDSDPKASYEEERRVAYVALTRAREEVTILYSKVYKKDEKEFALYPSSFLKESDLLFKREDLSKKEP